VQRRIKLTTNSVKRTTTKSHNISPLDLVKQDGMKLSTFSQDKITFEICYAAVEQNGLALQYVPAQFKSAKLCFAAVEQNWWALQYVPSHPDVKTEAVCIAAVRKNRIAFQFIPIGMRTEEMCLAAVENDGSALQDVPEKFRSESLCLLALYKNPLALQYFPNEMKTDIACSKAVERNGLALQHVPMELRTETLCLAALKETSLALKHIPNKTRAIWLAAIKHDPSQLQFVPPEIKDDEFMIEAIKVNGLALQYAPLPRVFNRVIVSDLKPDKIDKNTLYMQITNDFTDERGYLISGGVIAHWLKGDEIISKKIRKNNANVKLILHKLSLITNQSDMVADKELIESITQKFEIDKEVDVYYKNLYLNAVKQNGLALQYVPSESQTELLCLAAVEQNGSAFAFVPNALKTPAVCLAAVTKNGLELENIPLTIISIELILAAIKQNGQAFNFIPSHLKTREVFLAAIRENSLILQFVPEEEKISIIKEIGIANLIANNYLSIRYLPKAIDYTNEINEFLSNVEHVSVRHDTDLEICNIQSVYATADKRRGKTVCINNGTTNDLNELLNRLNEVNIKDSLHLVLAGHANERAESLAGMNVNNIVNACKTCPKIKSIHLLGCNTAKARRLSQEQNMLDAYVANSKRKESQKFGFELTINAPPDPSNDTIFKQRCLFLCQKYKLDGLYILSNDGEGKSMTPRLIAVKIDGDDIKIKVSSVPKNRIQDNTKILSGSKGKALSFPKNDGEFVTLRGINSHLDPSELKALRALTYAQDRFDHAHKKYQNDKNVYPFLRTFFAETADLKDSLTKRIADTILREDAIKWDIQIKSPTKALHVDYKNKRLLVSRTHLYNTKMDIEYKRLQDERDSDIQKMKENQQNNNDNTMAKNVVVTVRKSI